MKIDSLRNPSMKDDPFRVMHPGGALVEELLHANFAGHSPVNDSS